MKTGKKILTALFILVTLCTTTLNINADWYDYDFAYVYLDEAKCERDVSYEAYDKDGNVVIKYEKEFNDAGLCTKELTYYLNESNELKESELIIYEYNNENKIVKWDFYSYLDGEAVLKQTRTFEYSGNEGNEKLIVHEENRDIVVEERSVKYDNEGREISFVSKELNDQEEMILSTECTTTYDENSTTSESYYYNGGELFDGFYQKTEYDDQGREKMVTQKNYNLETGKFDINEEVLEYVYDSLGNKTISSIMLDGQPSPYYSGSHELNEKGYIKEEITIMNGVGYEMGIKDEYEYDDNGNRIKDIYYDYTENKEWEYQGESTCDYDDRGLLIKEYSKMIYDGEEDGSTYLYFYELVHRDLKEVKESGYKTYYHCDECGKNYSDNKGQQIIYDLDSWKENNKQSDFNPIVYVLIGTAIGAIIGIVIYKSKKKTK